MKSFRWKWNLNNGQCSTGPNHQKQKCGGSKAPKTSKTIPKWKKSKPTAGKETEAEAAKETRIRTRTILIKKPGNKSAATKDLMIMVISRRAIIISIDRIKLEC